MAVCIVLSRDRHETGRVQRDDLTLGDDGLLAWNAKIPSIPGILLCSLGRVSGERLGMDSPQHPRGLLELGAAADCGGAADASVCRGRRSRLLGAPRPDRPQ